MSKIIIIIFILLTIVQAETKEQEQIRLSKMLDQLDALDFNDAINSAMQCIEERRFNCARENIAKAERLVTNKQQKSVISKTQGAFDFSDAINSAMQCIEERIYDCARENIAKAERFVTNKQQKSIISKTQGALVQEIELEKEEEWLAQKAREERRRRERKQELARLEKKLEKDRLDKIRRAKERHKQKQRDAQRQRNRDIQKAQGMAYMYGTAAGMNAQQINNLSKDFVDTTLSGTPSMKHINAWYAKEKNRLQAKREANRIEDERRKKELSRQKRQREKRQREIRRINDEQLQVEKKRERESQEKAQREQRAAAKRADEKRKREQETRRANKKRLQAKKQTVYMQNGQPKVFNVKGSSQYCYENNSANQVALDDAKGRANSQCMNNYKPYIYFKEKTFGHVDCHPCKTLGNDGKRCDAIVTGWCVR